MLNRTAHTEICSAGFWHTQGAGKSYFMVFFARKVHRRLDGRLALDLRNALPNAGYIGFPSTPLFKADEITHRIFGDYVSTYDFQRAVDDHATMPLYYGARGALKLALIQPRGNLRPGSTHQSPDP